MSAFQLWKASLADLWRHSPGRVALTVPLSFLAVSAQILSSGLLIAYIASRLGSGEARIRLPGGGIDASAYIDSDAEWIALIAVASILGYALAYGERLFELELGRSYSLYATRGALAEIGGSRTSIGFDPGTLVRGAAALAGTIAPIARGLLLAGVLFWIRWELAAALIVVNLALAIPLQRRLRRRIVSVGEDRRNAAQEYRQATKTTTAHLAETDSESDREALIDGFVDSALVQHRVRSGLQVRESQQRASLLAGLLTTAGTIALAAVIASIPDTADGRDAILGLLLFAVVLGLFYNSIRTLLNQLATFHKHEHNFVRILTGESGRALGPGLVAFTRSGAPLDESDLEEWLATFDLDPGLAPVMTTPEEVRDIASAIGSGPSNEEIDTKPSPVSRVAEILDRTATETSSVAVTVNQAGEPTIPEGWVIAAAQEIPGVVVVPSFVFDDHRPGQIRALLRLVKHHLVLITEPSTELVELIASATGTVPVDLDAGDEVDDDEEDDEWQ